MAITSPACPGFQALADAAGKYGLGACSRLPPAVHVRAPSAALGAAAGAADRCHRAQGRAPGRRSRRGALAQLLAAPPPPAPAASLLSANAEFSVAWVRNGEKDGGSPCPGSLPAQTRHQTRARRQQRAAPRCTKARGSLRRLGHVQQDQHGGTRPAAIPVGAAPAPRCLHTPTGVEAWGCFGRACAKGPEVWEPAAGTRTRFGSEVRGQAVPLERGGLTGCWLNKPCPACTLLTLLGAAGLRGCILKLVPQGSEKELVPVGLLQSRCCCTFVPWVTREEQRPGMLGTDLCGGGLGVVTWITCGAGGAVPASPGAGGEEGAVPASPRAGDVSQPRHNLQLLGGAGKPKPRLSNPAEDSPLPVFSPQTQPSSVREQRRDPQTAEQALPKTAQAPSESTASSSAASVSISAAGTAPALHKTASARPGTWQARAWRLAGVLMGGRRNQDGGRSPVTPPFWA